jgi:hypothetical protein
MCSEPGITGADSVGGGEGGGDSISNPGSQTWMGAFVRESLSVLARIDAWPSPLSNGMLLEPVKELIAPEPHGA